MVPSALCTTARLSSSSFSSTTLCEFWLAQLFLSIASSPTSFVSNFSPPSSSDHSLHHLPILPLAYSELPSSFSFFSSTTLCEFWLAQLFLSIASSPASFVSNCSPPSSSNHSSHRLPILLLAFPSVLLHAVSICIRSWPLFH